MDKKNGKRKCSENTNESHFLPKTLKMEGGGAFAKISESEAWNEGNIFLSSLFSQNSPTKPVPKNSKRKTKEKPDELAPIFQQMNKNIVAFFPSEEIKDILITLLSPKNNKNFTKIDEQSNKLFSCNSIHDTEFKGYFAYLLYRQYSAILSSNIKNKWITKVVCNSAEAPREEDIPKIRAVIFTLSQLFLKDDQAQLFSNILENIENRWTVKTPSEDYTSFCVQINSNDLVHTLSARYQLACILRFIEDFPQLKEDLLHSVDLKDMIQYDEESSDCISKFSQADCNEINNIFQAFQDNGIFISYIESDKEFVNLLNENMKRMIAHNRNVVKRRLIDHVKILYPLESNPFLWIAMENLFYHYKIKFSEDTSRISCSILKELDEEYKNLYDNIVFLIEGDSHKNYCTPESKENSESQSQSLKNSSSSILHRSSYSSSYSDSESYDYNGYVIDPKDHSFCPRFFKNQTIEIIPFVKIPEISWSSIRDQSPFIKVLKNCLPKGCVLKDPVSFLHESTLPLTHLVQGGYFDIENTKFDSKLKIIIWQSENIPLQVVVVQRSNGYSSDDSVNSYSPQLTDSTRIKSIVIGNEPRYRDTSHASENICDYIYRISDFSRQKDPIKLVQYTLNDVRCQKPDSVNTLTSIEEVYIIVWIISCISRGLHIPTGIAAFSQLLGPQIWKASRDWITGLFDNNNMEY